MLAVLLERVSILLGWGWGVRIVMEDTVVLSELVGSWSGPPLPFPGL